MKAPDPESGGSIYRKEAELSVVAPELDPVVRQLIANNYKPSGKYSPADVLEELGKEARSTLERHAITVEAHNALARVDKAAGLKPLPSIIDLQDRIRPEVGKILAGLKDYGRFPKSFEKTQVIGSSAIATAVLAFSGYLFYLGVELDAIRMCLFAIFTAILSIPFGAVAKIGFVGGKDYIKKKHTASEEARYIAEILNEITKLRQEMDAHDSTHNEKVQIKIDICKDMLRKLLQGEAPEVEYSQPDPPYKPYAKAVWRGYRSVDIQSSEVRIEKLPSVAKVVGQSVDETARALEAERDHSAVLEELEEKALLAKEHK